MVSGIFPGDLNVGTALHPHVSVGQGVVIEMLLTGQLVFTVFMLAAEKHAATFIAPVGIGLSGFIAELIGKFHISVSHQRPYLTFVAGVFFTGGSLNPARSLAPAIVTRDFPTYHWIYWVGPLAGSFLAVLLYKLIKALEYETAQDDDSQPPELPTKVPMRASSNARSEGRSDLESAPPPSTHLSPPQPTYSKVPYIQDKEAEKSGLPTCTGD